MTIQNIKQFEKREKIYRRTACNYNADLIQKVGCVGTACWYHCENICNLWEQKHKKHWGMHEEYNKKIPYTSRANK